MKMRKGFVSNSSSTSYVVCNADKLKLEDIFINESQLDPRHTVESVKKQIQEIIDCLQKDIPFGTEVGYSNYSNAFSQLTEHFLKYDSMFLVYEMECGADGMSYIVNVSKKLIDSKNESGLVESTEDRYGRKDIAKIGGDSDEE